MILSPRRSTDRANLLCVAFICATLTGAGAAGELLYYEDAERVVITNTPSRGDVRPVPGFASNASTPRTAQRLPTTIYDPFIERVARENGVSPSLVKAVALVESGFDPHAVSSKGAQGLMQLMPGTAQEYGVRDAFDPLQNLRAGAKHLRRLLDEFDGDLTLALAAYNAGSGAVRRHGGVPAYRETREYVRKVQGKLGDSTRHRRETRPAPAKPIRVRREADGSVTFVN